MAYRVYITPAVVVGSKINNTSDKSYLLFTRDAGMVWASAKSVREERSKHRYALQDFSVIRVSLVRGKSGWRVTGSEALSSLYFTAKSREERGLIRNTLRLLRRLLHGETPVQPVYDDILSVFPLLEEDLETVETTLHLRILHKLGYIAPSAAFEGALEASSVHEAVSRIGEKGLEEAKKAIKKALEASQL